MVVPTPCQNHPSCTPSASTRRSGSRSRCLKTADVEWAFPRGRELVQAGCPLDQPEHKNTLLEGSWLDLPGVVTA